MVVEQTPRMKAAFCVSMTKNTSILIDEFVNVKAGNAYRLFPFGRIVKDGKVREITPEFAATIKLPHFKPAIKLGSHDDATPAGGHIVSLEVRSDGLYAVPEYNDKGAQALQDGAYRYHSPEIIWAGGLENPTDGSVMNGPLLIGDALLHTPHLGEAAALYSVEVIESNKEQSNMNDQMNIPVSFWEKYIAPLLEKKQEVKEVTVEKIVEPVDYSAIKAENEKFKADQQRLQAETERKARVEKFTTDLKETKADVTIAELLADVPAETAEAVMKQFKALSAQINESKLTGEIGSEGASTTDDPKAAFNAAVLALTSEKKINYNAAFEQVKAEKPDLFKAAFKK